MKLSHNWLSQYVDLTDKNPDDLESALTLIGFEVEDIDIHGLPQLDKVCVGEVLEMEQHPNADRLSVCRVNVGEDEPKNIVCGAKNFKVGDRVPVALPGARLGDFKIKKSKLRGVPSEGMMCSAKEIGLGESHEGLLILEERPDIGTPINDVFTDTDTVYDIEVTPNRPDCLSHLGIARELAAYFNLEYKQPEENDHSKASGEQLVSAVEVNTETCPLYYAYTVRNVKIAPSPDWMQKALHAVGLRPINNIVDITNYVLLETGQPLHAFDAKKIKGGKIIVRQAIDKESITTLDEKERELSDRMTVIADTESPLVIAGVMGSVDAEVDDSTTDIVLEAAYFKPSDIRWTSRRLALSTDSSYRFERGIDPHGTAYAAQRCIDLILELAGGELSGKPIQVGELPALPQPIPLEPKFVRDYCGFGPNGPEIKAVLERLNLSIKGNEDEWEVSPPSSRRDLTRPVDLVEEFIRIYGTDKIPEIPVRATGTNRKDAAQSRFTDSASELLRGQQYTECCHYTLRDEREVEQWFGKEQSRALKVANPLASDQSHLRPSLLPSLLDALKLNNNNGNTVRRLFEVGKVYRCFENDEGNLWELLSLSFVALQNPTAREWTSSPKPDLHSARTTALQLLNLAGARSNGIIFEPAVEPIWQEQHTAGFGHFAHEGCQIRVGTLNVDTIKEWNLPCPVIAGELLFSSTFFEKERKRTKFKPFSHFPASERDLALIVEKWVPAELIRGELHGLSNIACDKAFDVESVDVFDVYKGEGLPDGKKSVALSIRFRAEDRTLTDAEVNDVFDKIQVQLEEQTDYSIRK